jgi:hypothetical protein
MFAIIAILPLTLNPPMQKMLQFRSGFKRNSSNDISGLVLPGKHIIHGGKSGRFIDHQIPTNEKWVHVNDRDPANNNVPSPYGVRNPKAIVE